MIRYLFTLVLFMHGIGHMLFMANTWGYWRTTSGRAWLLTDVLHLSQPLQGSDHLQPPDHRVVERAEYVERLLRAGVQHRDHRRAALASRGTYCRKCPVNKRDRPGRSAT